MSSMGTICRRAPDMRSGMVRRTCRLVQSSMGQVPRDLFQALVPALMLLAAACGDAQGGTETGSDAAGEETTSTGGSTTGMDTVTPTTSTSNGPSSGSGGTGEPGSLKGLLTFTLYPADAGGSPELLGMAGAWRT